MAVKNKSRLLKGDGKKYTAFRCPVDLLEKVKARAKADRRSLSNFLICLIEEAVK